MKTSDSYFGRKKLLDATDLFGDNVIKNLARYIYALLLTELVRLRWLYIGQVRFFFSFFFSFLSLFLCFFLSFFLSFFFLPFFFMDKTKIEVHVMND